MTYGNSKLEWLSSTIAVNYWPYRPKTYERKEYNEQQTKNKQAAIARDAAQKIAKSKNPKPTLDPVPEKKEGDDEEENEDDRFS